MIYTQHLEVRMQQRCMSHDMVQAIFSVGALDESGEKVVLSGRDLETEISEFRYEIASLRRRGQKLERTSEDAGARQIGFVQRIEALKRECEKLERLRRKGGGVLVTNGTYAITVYRYEEGKRA